MCGIGCEVAPT